MPDMPVVSVIERWSESGSLMWEAVWHGEEDRVEAALRWARTMWPYDRLRVLLCAVVQELKPGEVDERAKQVAASTGR